MHEMIGMLLVALGIKVGFSQCGDRSVPTAMDIQQTWPGARVDETTTIVHYLTMTELYVCPVEVQRVALRLALRVVPALHRA